MHDLRPYSCTYNHCESADQLYDSWSDWVSHELLAHNQEWQCIHHLEQEFQTREDYVEHIKATHAADSHLLLSPEMLNPRRIESSRSNRLCPFCLIEEHDMSTMQKHVAWHLETIALFALPRSTGLEQGSEQGDLDSNQSGRVNQDSRIGDIDPSLLSAASSDQDQFEDVEHSETFLSAAALSQALASGAIPDTSGQLDPLSMEVPNEPSPDGQPHGYFHIQSVFLSNMVSSDSNIDYLLVGQMISSSVSWESPGWGRAPSSTTSVT
jgi:hypothetical protein